MDTLWVREGADQGRIGGAPGITTHVGPAPPPPHTEGELAFSQSLRGGRGRSASFRRTNHVRTVTHF